VNEPKPAAAVPRPDRHVFFWLATASLVVAIFSRAQQILVPLALSVVIAFALSPVVKRIERRLGRAAAIAMVAVVALAAVTGFGYLLKYQLVANSGQTPPDADSGDPSRNPGKRTGERAKADGGRCQRCRLHAARSAHQGRATAVDESDQPAPAAPMTRPARPSSARCLSKPSQSVS
jgi:hypothetical protein